jgi:hypothetical protein
MFLNENERKKNFFIKRYIKDFMIRFENLIQHKKRCDFTNISKEARNKVWKQRERKYMYKRVVKNK